MKTGRGSSSSLRTVGPSWCHAEKCGRANVLPLHWPESCWDGLLDGGPGLTGRDLQLMDEHVGERVVEHGEEIFFLFFRYGGINADF